MKEKNTKEIIEDAFGTYAAAVAQSRALVDVRDGLKPALRLISYYNFKDNLIFDKKSIKFQKLVASAFTGYIHGDAACYGVAIRAAKPFAFRYPIYFCDSSYGTLQANDSESSMRYTEGGLGKIGVEMFKGINEQAIEVWYDNFDGSSQYPSVLPSLGFWGLVNGTQGIGVGLACSIPQFNLIEMNTALIKMLNNEPFDLPLPDFATGATLINKDEVKTSLEIGSGMSCKIRATIEYNKKDHCLTVTELPFSTYTETICQELEAMLLNEDCMISRFNDLTGEQPLLKIYLEKNADIDQVIYKLYKETSLENYFGINLTMLKDGKYPQVFSLKEAMQEHLDHEAKCYTNIFNFRLEKEKLHLHILEGYIHAQDIMEDIVKKIKASKNKAEAKESLVNDFDFTDIQADAILKLTLSKLTSFEVNKLVKDRDDTAARISELEKILGDRKLLNKEIEKGLREIMNKYGDARRTKLINMDDEKVARLLYFTEDGKAFLNIPKKEKTISTIMEGTPYMAVTQKGMVYRSSEVPLRAKKVFPLDSDDKIINVLPCFESDFLVIYNNEKKFRCISIKSLNKKKTTLTLKGIVNTYVTKKKITKSEYNK